MSSDYRRGFKAEAEKLALAVREAMGVSWNGRLDPRALAEHLEVQVFELPELLSLGFPKSALDHLLGAGSREFSAALFELHDRRLIIANPVHSAGRQASNIVHEVAHLLLKHRPPEVLLADGCRRWNAAMEREADWLAGELLVPRQAALQIARAEASPEVSAQQYGVTVSMMRWRLNGSGARKQVMHERAARHERSGRGVSFRS